MFNGKKGNLRVQFGVAATYLQHRLNYTSVANGTKNLLHVGI